MKPERSWIGTVCGSILFIVVCLSLLLYTRGVFHAGGNSELGLLLFLLPGAAASCLSPGQRALRLSPGAVLATPVCIVTIRPFFVTHRMFWQGMV